MVRSGLSYRPEPGRVVNVGYRFTRDVLHQVDASSQWRWSEKWQTVARMNYSLQDQRILEGLAGLEYNACCWSLRFVLQHLTTATQKTTTAAFLQLELNGLMQIGSNPLHVLQRSIPGYTRTGSPGKQSRGRSLNGDHKPLFFTLSVIHPSASSIFANNAYSHGHEIFVASPCPAGIAGRWNGCCPATSHSGSIETIDHIVAVVNENVITRHELDEVLNATLKQLQKQGVQPPPPAVLEKQMLDRIIVNRVQLQLAKETGLTVSDTELDQTLRRIAQENKMSLTEFYSALEQDGVSFQQVSG